MSFKWSLFNSVCGLFMCSHNQHVMSELWQGEGGGGDKVEGGLRRGV